MVNGKTFVIATLAMIGAGGASCGGGKPALIPTNGLEPEGAATEPTEGAVDVDQIDTAVEADATRPKAGGTYTGLGAESLSAETIAKYAPPPLDPKVSARIQALLDVRGAGGGALTSDGKRIVFSWKITGSSQVWRQDGPMAWPTQLTGGQDNTTVAGLTPDDKWVIVQRDEGGAENPGLYLQPIGGGALVEIQKKPKVQTFFCFASDDGKSIFYRANDEDPASFTIYRWDIAAKTAEKVFGEKGLWSVVDQQPGRMLLANAFGNFHIEIFDYDLATKKLTPVAGQNESEFYDARYGAKPGTVILHTNQPGEYLRLYEWKAGKIAAITPEIAHDVASFDIDHARKRIVYSINEDGYSRVAALDAKTHKPIALPKLPAADNVYAGGSTRNGRFTTFAYDGATTPQTMLVYDWTTRKLTTWRPPSTPEIDTRTFAKASLESYTARDGTKIPMFVWRPAKCATDPCPVVVMFHGGPEGQSKAGFSVYAQMYVDAGFTLVLPNVRGSDGYGKTWLHMDDGPKRLDVITDLEDVSIYIRKAWAKDGRAPKIGVTGGSYGGYATLMAMSYFAGAYDAGVEEVGIANLVTFLMNTAPYRRILRVAEYGDPDKDHDALVKLSPVTYADRVKAPLLIIQGVNDPRVPVGEALLFHDALAAKGVEAPVILFADEGHGTSKRSNLVLAIGHTIAFFQKHLQ